MSFWRLTLYRQCFFLLNFRKKILQLKMGSRLGTTVEVMEEIGVSVLNRDMASDQSEKTNYVFISYSSKNKLMANYVRFLLKQNNISYWMAPDDIPVGSDYSFVINDALENCSCLLLLLTKESQKSRYCVKEVERAISYNKPILPMQLEDLELNSGLKFLIGNAQFVFVPELSEDSPGVRRILSGINRYVNTRDISRDAHNEKNEGLKTQKDIILDDDPHYFCKFTFLSSGTGSLFFYSEKSTLEQIVRIKITKAFWDEFAFLCKQIICALFPGVSEQGIMIMRTKPLGIYDCAPYDGRPYYDNKFAEHKYVITFSEGHIQGKTPEKYDSARITCADGFEVSLFKGGNHIFSGSSDETTLADCGIDEKALYKAAAAMIKFVSRDPYCMMSKGFRRSVYDDGSGSFIVDYCIDRTND